MRIIDTGKVRKIYERWLTKQYRRYVRRNGEVVESAYYTMTLPASWVDTWKEDAKTLILLETEDGNLLILHPNNTEKMKDELRSLSEKVPVEVYYRVRDGVLWKIRGSSTYSPNH
ncbi:hypothetical protein JCM16138_24640 [Thermococcus atlanticus]